MTRPLLPLAPVEYGCPTEEGAVKTLECIKLACELVRSGEDRRGRAIVTAPVNKEEISRICPGFIGHTEFLRDTFAVPMTTMVMAGKTLNVAPATRHIPIEEVAGALNIDLIVNTLSQVVDARQLICGKEDAVIGVCALNPHGGEGGKIGREEIDVIIPAVEKAKKNYPDIIGPLSADVAFHKAFHGKMDIVLAMYHDQGLGPFKMIDFDNGVNLTLGLGIIRTSPDHRNSF